MEYSVGSLSDLITGKITPNKPKVVQKEIVKKTKEVSEEHGSENKLNNSDQLVPEINDSLKLGKKSKKAKKISLDNIKKEFGITQNKKSKKKSQKRKLDESLQDSTVSSTANITSNLADSDIEDSPPPKKQKLNKNELNAERRIKNKVKEEKKADPQTTQRTIFVGNIPIKISKKKIGKYFKKYGLIESVRIRGITPADPKTPKKVAVLKNEFHPNRSTVHCYVRFQNKEDAEKAEAENGAIFEGHHLRVHLCESTEKPDESKAIFIGNLSFDAEEEELWKLFEPCGKISHIRIVRDQRTGMGKGFAYVNFKDSDAVQLALQMENVVLKNRELRIHLCNLNRAKKNKKRNKREKINKAGKPKFRSRPSFGRKQEGTENSEAAKPTTEFQGSKFDDKKKKKKVNKGILEKKKLAKKIAPKSK